MEGQIQEIDVVVPEGMAAGQCLGQDGSRLQQSVRGPLEVDET